MIADRLIISGDNNPVVALGMTGASFGAAQKQQVRNIEADTDAMAFIASRVGFTEASALLLPLAIITRDNDPSRSLISRWDDRLPEHQGMPVTGGFFVANDLQAETPAFVDWERFAGMAKSVGASALTEVSIASWDRGARHAGDFAVGLLLGQRPIELPPRPSALRRVVKFLTPTGKVLKILNEVKADQTMPEPFIITP